VVSEKLAKFSKLLKTMVRIGVLMPVVDAYARGEPIKSGVMYRHIRIDDVDFGEPTVEVVESLMVEQFAAGRMWYWDRATEDDRMKQIKAKSESLLKKIRKHLYDDMDAFSFVEVGDGEDQRKAA